MLTECHTPKQLHLSQNVYDLNLIFISAQKQHVGLRELAACRQFVFTNGKPGNPLSRADVNRTQFILATEVDNSVGTLSAVDQVGSAGLLDCQALELALGYRKKLQKAIRALLRTGPHEVPGGAHRKHVRPVQTEDVLKLVQDLQVGASDHEQLETSRQNVKLLFRSAELHGHPGREPDWLVGLKLRLDRITDVEFADQVGRAQAEQTVAESQKHHQFEVTSLDQHFICLLERLWLLTGQFSRFQVENKNPPAPVPASVEELVGGIEVASSNIGDPRSVYSR